MSSPWVSSTASAQALAIIKAADDLQRKIPGSLFYAYHGVGFTFLVTDSSALTFSHGYPTLEQAIGNSNDAGGPTFSAGPLKNIGTGGGADLAYLETASGAAGSGAGGGTGSNSVVAAWFSVTTIHDQQSQGQSPTGPSRRQVTGISVGNVLTGSNANASGKTVGDVVKTLSNADQAALKSGLNTGKAANPNAVPLASASSAAGGFALPSLENFFGALGQATTWLRVAKVAIGGALLLVGLAKLTGADRQVALLGKAVARAPLL